MFLKYYSEYFKKYYNCKVTQYIFKILYFCIHSNVYSENFEKVFFIPCKFIFKIHTFIQIPIVEYIVWNITPG